MLTDFEHLQFDVFSVFKATHRMGRYKVLPRPFAAISLRLNGSGVFFIDGKKLTSRQGDVLFIPANISYEVEYSVNDFIVIHLLNCNYTNAEVISMQNSTAIETHFVNLLEKWDFGCSANLAKSYVYALLDALARYSTPISENGNISKCLQYMEEHFDDADMNVKTLCNTLYISRSTIQRLFLEHLKCTPHAYLTRLRLQHSLKLLSDDSLTVKQVALGCGFKDEKYFSCAFKNAYGYPPSKLRKHAHM